MLESIVEKNRKSKQEGAPITVKVPKTVDCLAGILTVIPFQLLSLYIAVANERNVSEMFT